jgi:ABC-type molybdenum transport system ATPase subunit/photorepair protein PhrA
VQGLEKSYQELRVLRGVDFDVARGSIFALLGSNGAGKTTVVNILSTLLRADAGTAAVTGFDVAAQGAQVRESISLTGQFAAVDATGAGWPRDCCWTSWAAASSQAAGHRALAECLPQKLALSSLARTTELNQVPPVVAHPDPPPGGGSVRPAWRLLPAHPLAAGGEETATRAAEGAPSRAG